MPRYKRFYEGKFYERSKDFPSLELTELKWIEDRMTSRLGNEDIADEFRRVFNKTISKELVRRIKLKNGIHDRPRRNNLPLNRQ